MEIVQVLLGGLGNQLFMLAAATEIARQTDCELSVYYDPEPDLQGRTLTINQLFPNARFVNAISPKEGDVSYSESGEELDDEGTGQRPRQCSE